MKDFLPLPDTLAPVTDPDKEEVSQTLAETPTMSHALAVAEHDEKGHAQESHGAEVKDLGWNESEDAIPSPLVGGLSNDDLWVLIRRFNKVCSIVSTPLNMRVEIDAFADILYSKCTMSKKSLVRYRGTSTSISLMKRNSRRTSCELQSNVFT